MEFPPDSSLLRDCRSMVFRLLLLALVLLVAMPRAGLAAEGEITVLSEAALVRGLALMA
jgi:hypothetical protein